MSTTSAGKNPSVDCTGAGADSAAGTAGVGKELGVDGGADAAAATVAAGRVAAASAVAAAVGTSSAVYAPPTGSPAFLLNYKQQLFLDIVVEHAHSVDACRREERRVPPGSGVQGWPQPLRIILTGTAGTGKTVVINEIVRFLGDRRT